MASTFLDKTFKHLGKITDTGTDRGANHSLIDMISLTLCATICGAHSGADVERYGNSKLDWLRKFVPLEFVIPSHRTLGRVFVRLDSVEFYAALPSWAKEIAGCLHGQTVAFDGKTLRGSSILPPRSRPCIPFLLGHVDCLCAWDSIRWIRSPMRSRPSKS
jgi:hypothetical protein